MTPNMIGNGKRGHYERGLFTGKALNSLESIEDGRILLSFPGGSPESLESLNSLESLDNGHFCKDPFSKRPLFQSQHDHPSVPSSMPTVRICGYHFMLPSPLVAQTLATPLRMSSNSPIDLLSALNLVPIRSSPQIFIVIYFAILPAISAFRILSL